MGKRILSLYVDDEDINLAKSKNLNLSSWFREMLSIELKIKELPEATTKEELIIKLKSKMAQLSEQLKISNDQLLLKDKEIKDLKKENSDLLNKDRKVSEEGVALEW